MPTPAQTTCAWFRNCDNPATTTRPGPILSSPPGWGEVPICARCAALVDVTAGVPGRRSSPPGRRRPR